MGLFAFPGVQLCEMSSNSFQLSPVWSGRFGVYLRGLLSHVQMIVVAASLDLSWPYFAATFLAQQSAIGSVSDQFFSFECVIAERHQ